MTPLRPHEAELLGAITDEERARWHYRPGPASLDPTNRAADRLLWAKVEALLSQQVRWSVLAKPLGTSDTRLCRLRQHHRCWGQPVWTEEQVAARQARQAQEEAERQALRAEWIAEWQAEKAKRRENTRQWRAEVKRHERDEAREIKTQAVHCLIEAYEEMRGHPSVGPHALAKTPRNQS